MALKFTSDNAMTFTPVDENGDEDVSRDPFTLAWSSDPKEFAKNLVECAKAVLDNADTDILVEVG